MCRHTETDGADQVIVVPRCGSNGVSGTAAHCHCTLSPPDPGFESRLRGDFSGSSHTSDSKTGTQVATLSGAWRYRVSTTGGPVPVYCDWVR